MKQTDKEWAARKLRGLVEHVVRWAEKDAKSIVPMAQQEAADKLRTVAEVKQRLGMR